MFEMILLKHGEELGAWTIVSWVMGELDEMDEVRNATVAVDRKCWRRVARGNGTSAPEWSNPWYSNG